MGYYVYVLLSEDGSHTYVGQTEDLERRVKQHNAGRVRSTKAFSPWRLIHAESLETREQAKDRELWYKTPSGRRRIAGIIKQRGGTGEQE